MKMNFPVNIFQTSKGQDASTPLIVSIQGRPKKRSLHLKAHIFCLLLQKRLNQFPWFLAHFNAILFSTHLLISIIRIYHGATWRKVRLRLCFQRMLREVQHNMFSWTSLDICWIKLIAAVYQIKIVPKGDWGHLLTLTLTSEDLESHIVVNVSSTSNIIPSFCF